jgi:hypothetical protein
MLRVLGSRSLDCIDGLLPFMALRGSQKWQVRYNLFCCPVLAELLSFSLTHLPVIDHPDDQLNGRVLSLCF